MEAAKEEEVVMVAAMAVVVAGVAKEVEAVAVVEAVEGEVSGGPAASWSP